MLIPSNRDLDMLDNSLQDDPAKGLHVTLHYLGKAAESPVSKGLVVATLQELAPAMRPVKGLVTGVGLLGDDDPQASVLLLQKPAIAQIRETIKEALPDIPPDKYPVFTPHLTVGYGIPTQPRRIGTRINFDRIAAWWAEDEAVTFMLGVDSYRVDL